jgi:hypothetical protein
LGGREVPPGLYKPPPTPKFSFYSAKTRKKEREERKREEKAAKPCSHVDFGKMMTEYMTKKAASVQLHHVWQCGTQELKFEIASKDRA